MSTFLSRLKSNQGLSIGSATTSLVKSKAQDASTTANDLKLDDSRPARLDGGDKSFGMHNPHNTCYANSVLQCLYFSESFRHNILNFPVAHQLANSKSPSLPQKLGPDLDDDQPTVAGAGAPSPLRVPVDSKNAGLQRSPSAAATTTPASTQPENKDSFEPWKKQLMAAGPHIRADAPQFEQYGMSESLFTSLKDLFVAMVADHNRSGIVVPTKFMDTLRAEHADYRGPQHQDAHEFLNLLLNEVVDSVEDYTKKANEAKQHLSVASPVSQALTQQASWIRDMFEGTLTSETRCLSCENISQRDEIFLDLSVDLEEHSSVSSCLQRFSQEETLTEDDKFHCDECGGLQVAEKRMKIRKLPKTLALHMKRFKYDEERQDMSKLFHRVVFPYNLRLFNTTDDADDPDRIYELYAVIVHLGSSPFHGHYVSIIKTASRGWLLFDDELVLPVDASYVKNFFGGRTSACAYVLFYQETTIEEVMAEQDLAQVDADPQGTKAANASLLSPTTPGMEENSFNFDQGSPRMRPISPGRPAAASRFNSSLDSPAPYPSGAPGDLKEPNRSFELPPSMPGVSKSKDQKKSSEIDVRPSHTQLGLSNSQNGLSHVADNPTRKSDEDKSNLSRHTSKKSSGGLSRFRATSFSVKGKSKLFGSKSDNKDQADGQDSTESPTPPPKIPDHDKGSFSTKTRPKIFGGPSKSERADAVDSEAMEEEQQAHEALLPTSPNVALSTSAVPHNVRHEKERSSFSKLWSRSDKSNKPDTRDVHEIDPNITGPGARPNDSPEKPIRHMSSRFGLGRKKSGNPLA